MDFFPPFFSAQNSLEEYIDDLGVEEDEFIASCEKSLETLHHEETDERIQEVRHESAHGRTDPIDQLRSWQAAAEESYHRYQLEVDNGPEALQRAILQSKRETDLVSMLQADEKVPNNAPATVYVDESTLYRPGQQRTWQERQRQELERERQEKQEKSRQLAAAGLADQPISIAIPSNVPGSGASGLSSSSGGGRSNNLGASLPAGGTASGSPTQQAGAPQQQQPAEAGAGQTGQTGGAFTAATAASSTTALRRPTSGEAMRRALALSMASSSREDHYDKLMKASQPLDLDDEDLLDMAMKASELQFELEAEARAAQERRSEVQSALRSSLHPVDASARPEADIQALVRQSSKGSGGGLHKRQHAQRGGSVYSEGMNREHARQRRGLSVQSEGRIKETLAAIVYLWFRQKHFRRHCCVAY